MGFLETFGKKAIELTGNAIKAGTKAVQDHKEEIAAVGSALKKGAQIAGTGLEKFNELAGQTIAREQRNAEYRQRHIEREIERRSRGI